MNPVLNFSVGLSEDQRCIFFHFLIFVYFFSGQYWPKNWHLSLPGPSGCQVMYHNPKVGKETALYQTVSVSWSARQIVRWTVRLWDCQIFSECNKINTLYWIKSNECNLLMLRGEGGYQIVCEIRLGRKYFLLTLVIPYNGELSIKLLLLFPF